MLIESITGPRARVLITHTRPYDFDEKKCLWVHKVIDEEEACNIITDAGRRRVHTYLYGAGAQRTPLGVGLNYIALSNNAAAPSASDVALAGEIVDGPTTAGLARAVGAVTLPTGSGTQTLIQKTFTFTGVPGPQSFQKTALFDDPVTGTMAHEIQFTAKTLQTNDNVTLNFFVTLI
jgi:hypothetical protein